MHWRRKWQPTPVFLPGESQGRESLVGCHLWGRTESDTTEATQQQQQACHSFSSKEQESFNFMAAVTIHSDFGAQENEVCHCFHFFLHLFAMKWWDWMPWSWCLECCFKPAFSPFIKRLLFHQEFLFAFCHKGGVICISEVFGISPRNLVLHPARHFAWRTLFIRRSNNLRDGLWTATLLGSGWFLPRLVIYMQQVPYIWTFKLQTFKNSNLRSHIQSHKLVQMSGMHCHMHASSTSDSVCFTVQHCIEHSRTVSLFQAQDGWKQE